MMSPLDSESSLDEQENIKNPIKIANNKFSFFISYSFLGLLVTVGLCASLLPQRVDYFRLK
jgi:hypothetical protein